MKKERRNRKQLAAGKTISGVSLWPTILPNILLAVKVVWAMRVLQRQPGLCPLTNLDKNKNPQCWCRPSATHCDLFPRLWWAATFCFIFQRRQSWSPGLRYTEVVQESSEGLVSFFFTPPLNFKGGSLCTIGGRKSSHPYPCRRRLPLQPSCNIDRSYRSCLSFNDRKTTHIKHPEKHTNTLTHTLNTKTRLITQTRQATKAEAPGKWMKVELSFVSTAKSTLLLDLLPLLLHPCRWQCTPRSRGRESQLPLICVRTGWKSLHFQSPLLPSSACFLTMRSERLTLRCRWTREKTLIFHFLWASLSCVHRARLPLKGDKLWPPGPGSDAA